MSDGETGERTYWMVFQLALLAENPSFYAQLERVVRPFLRAYRRFPLVAANRQCLNGRLSGGGTVPATLKPGVRIAADGLRLCWTLERKRRQPAREILVPRDHDVAPLEVGSSRL